MKKKRTVYLGKVGKAFLCALDQGADILNASPRDLSRAVRMGGGLQNVRDYQWELRKDARRRAIKTLARNQLIQPVGRRSANRYEISKHGRLLLLREAMIATTKKLPLGVLCLVSFDIPERERFARRTIRTLLKDAGFEQIHASLWASRRRLTHLLKELMSLLHVEEWVSLFEARRC